MPSTAPGALLQAVQELADLIDIRGGRVEAGDLRRAAARWRETGRRPPSAAIEGIAAAGPERVLQQARRALPSLLRVLSERAVVDSADLLRLVRQAGVATLHDLLAAADDGRLERTFSADAATRLRHAAAVLRDEMPPLTLGRAWDVLEGLLPEIAAAAPQLTMEPAGAIRRGDAFAPSIVLVGWADRPEDALDTIAGITAIDRVTHRTTRRVIVVYRQAEVDIRIAAPDEYGSALFNATGSVAHCRAVTTRRGRTQIRAREEQVYADAGLPWIPPELREDRGELEAAASGTLPRLIERRDIRGDLHMHSTYSDGRDGMAAMVQACRALGYEYIAITDHSERAAAARTLAASDIPRQRAEIERLREQHPQIAILHGIEVDIMPDGGLDFPDAVLEQFDIVLASLHDAAGHDPGRLTERCLAAIQHPLVNVITHPANRLPGRRSGHPLDFDAVFAAAAETGTALEIDGAPGHLDLDGEGARAAAAAGALLVVDSDCHRALSLERQMRFGLGLARRGWLEPRHVLNTRPLDELVTYLRAKRL